MHQQQGQCSRRDAGNARGLPHGFRLVLVQLLAHFDRQRLHFHVIQIGRQRQAFIAFMTFDFARLAVDVTGVFQLNLQLFLDRFRLDAGAGQILAIHALERHQLVVADVRPRQQIG
jgi:hypothetical protein